MNNQPKDEAWESAPIGSTKKRSDGATVTKGRHDFKQEEKPWLTNKHARPTLHKPGKHHKQRQH